jgi:hypothetical protein
MSKFSQNTSTVLGPLVYRIRVKAHVGETGALFYILKIYLNISLLCTNIIFYINPELRNISYLFSCKL